MFSGFDSEAIIFCIDKVCIVISGGEQFCGFFVEDETATCWLKCYSWFVCLGLFFREFLKSHLWLVVTNCILIGGFVLRKSNAFWDFVADVWVVIEEIL